MRKVVSIIYFHHLELFTTTDYGTDQVPASKNQKCRFNKSFVVYALNNCQNSDRFYLFLFLFIFVLFLFVILLYFIVLYFIFTYIWLYLYKLLFVCSAFELPVLINSS